MTLAAENPRTFPDMGLADARHTLFSDAASSNEKEEARKVLMEGIERDNMAPFYQSLCERLGEAPNQALMTKMLDSNKEELTKLDARVEDAKENLGDTEVRDALVAKADYFLQIGDKDKCMEAFEVAYEKTVGAGGRLDNILTVIRGGVFFGDLSVVKKQIDRAEAELEKGGDWERRNKLRVYKGVYLMMVREFAGASKLFLESVATFTAVELLSFRQFVYYLVISCSLACDRKTLKTKVIDSSEVAQVIHETPHLKEYLTSFYTCKYDEFMPHFYHIITSVSKDRYLAKHVRFYARYMRLNVYRQFLAPYKSVTIAAMATAFGVSPQFIDEEVSSFISSGKLQCKIDKVGGTIQSETLDERNVMYREVIKQGDLVLNRIQKLSKVIDM
mmetsp:Transcript_18753/g.45222  ORF Transcript_18753/g.45222 Transcript_18753/m.45222 type:complete len:389 (-) Transcript_18753:69-1235(-)